MTDFDKLRYELEGFKADRRSEFELKPIEKWMIKELGVTRIKTGKGPGKKKGKGSNITYFHAAIQSLGFDGYFKIHKSRKKHECVTSFDFKKYLYPRLRDIINVLELEESSGIQR